MLKSYPRKKAYLNAFVSIRGGYDLKGLLLFWSSSRCSYYSNLLGFTL